MAVSFRKGTNEDAASVPEEMITGALSVREIKESVPLPWLWLSLARRDTNISSFVSAYNAACTVFFVCGAGVECSQLTDRARWLRHDAAAGVVRAELCVRACFCVCVCTFVCVCPSQKRHKGGRSGSQMGFPERIDTILQLNRARVMDEDGWDVYYVPKMPKTRSCTERTYKMDCRGEPGKQR